MNQVRIQVINEVGLHLRPLHLFLLTVNEFDSSIEMRNASSESEWKNAKSILDVLTLAVEQNHFIELKAEGEDEAEAIDALKSLIESDFLEE